MSHSAFNKARLYDSYPLRGLQMPEYPDTQARLRRHRGHPPSDAAPGRRLEGHPHGLDICDTGRRRNAVLGISAERDLLLEDDRLHIIFRREYDKGRRSAIVPVSAETHLLVTESLEGPDVLESGWLFPEGRLEYANPTDKPWNPDAATSARHGAEKELGIEYIPGRAWHGLERCHVTASWEEASGDAALVGDVIGNIDANLLRNPYRQLNRKRTSDHVDRVRRRFKEEADDGS